MYVIVFTKLNDATSQRSTRHVRADSIEAAAQQLTTLGYHQTDVPGLWMKQQGKILRAGEVRTLYEDAADF